MYILFCVNKTKSCAKCFEKREQFVLPFIRSPETCIRNKKVSFSYGHNLRSNILIYMQNKCQYHKGHIYIDLAFSQGIRM